MIWSYISFIGATLITSITSRNEQTAGITECPHQGQSTNGMTLQQFETHRSTAAYKLVTDQHISFRLPACLPACLSVCI